MEQSRIHYLLSRQKKGEITEQEISELELWYEREGVKENFTDHLSENGISALENSLLNRIGANLDWEVEEPVQTIDSKPAIFLGFGYKIAASVVLVLLSAIMFFLYQRSTDFGELSTAYGEVKTVLLPDGSEVILNGNSKIKYKDDWKEKSSREVFLTGEGYFNIIHTPNHQNMRVVTEDEFSVDVLGTQFTISARNLRTRVVLNKGKVQCNVAGNTSDSLVLLPGEMLSFTSDPNAYIKKEVNANMYSSWTEKKLILQNTALVDVFQMISDTYGYDAKVDSPEILNREISGSVPMENLDVLLEGIAVVCDVKIRKNAQTLVLSDRK